MKFLQRKGDNKKNDKKDEKKIEKKEVKHENVNAKKEVKKEERKDKISGSLYGKTEVKREEKREVKKEERKDKISGSLYGKTEVKREVKRENNKTGSGYGTQAVQKVDSNNISKESRKRSPDFEVINALTAKKKEESVPQLPAGIAETPPDQQSSKFKEAFAVMSKRNIKIVASIGSGNYSDVYIALSTDRNKYVAVKVIDLRVSSNNYRIKFMPREIQVIQKVKHENIIKIYEISQSENKVFIIMQFAQNGNLAEHIHKNGAIPEELCRRFFRSIVDGLHYMHCLGIAHRDVKLENILLNRNLVPKLADFSHSKYVDKSSGGEIVKCTTFCGSLPYFPPEILQLKPYDPIKYDIWSLGVCLYVMLFNKLPFNIDNQQLMLTNQLNSNWSYQVKSITIGSNAKDVMSRTMQPEMAKRCTTTTLIMHRFIRNVTPMYQNIQ